MKVSLSWLKDYVTPGIPARKLAEKLTISGLEVEKAKTERDDTVFELEITPNRPDCLSVWGLARETAAILNKPIKFPEITKRVRPSKRCPVHIEDTKGCTHYIGTLIEGVTVGKIAEGMRRRLASVGLRAINSVVDITNFCLMETGQPLHAFDFDKLSGGKIVVRRARRGEKITTLDDIERELDDSVLVIADADKPVAIAGIMGGKNTEVTAQTKNILLESACFNPVLIRRASRKLGLSTDSSYRFERGVDEAMVEKAAGRAVDLILKQAGGKITGRVDAGGTRQKHTVEQITISIGEINASIGADLKAARCKNILIKLGFRVKNSGIGLFKVTPPSFRKDVTETVDLIEEIARINGYDRIPLSFPPVRLSGVLADPMWALRGRVRSALMALGLNEVITYTMISRKSLELCNEQEIPVVAVFNPLSRDQEIMRPSLLSSFLTVAASNQNRGQKNIKIFEIGKVYARDQEKDVFGILMAGARSEDWRLTEKMTVDFYDLKGTLEQTLFSGGLAKQNIRFDSVKEKYFSSGQSAAVIINGKKSGIAGKIEEDVLIRWDIKQKDVYFAQVDCDALKDTIKSGCRYRPVPEFPTVSRDISLAIKSAVSAGDIERTIRETAGNEKTVVLSDVKFLELYEGDKIPEGQRGLVFSLTYRSGLAKTLRDGEVEQVHAKICQALIASLGVAQR